MVNQGAATIRVLLADDQALVRGALAALLERESDIEVVAQVADGDQAVDRAVRGDVDVCLLDIEMGATNGIDAAARIARMLPHCRTMMVTTFGRPGYLQRALDAGATGFVVKDKPASELAQAVRRVHAGLRVVDPALASESLFEGRNRLTAREQQVLRLAEDGSQVSRIARHLFLSPGTVRNHLSSAIGKTGAGN
ncbi:MAG: response regulator transcription factor, partial [Propionibacteriales bacterium]|nr:response regulator transcription factor [Propionibacteriales bacterium]